MSGKRKVLVIGSGGREHALAHRLITSESVGEVLVAPGNAGTAGGAPSGKVLRNVAGNPLSVAKAEKPDLARSARRLAWSSPSPSPAAADELVKEVRDDG